LATPKDPEVKGLPCPPYPRTGGGGAAAEDAAVGEWELAKEKKTPQPLSWGVSRAYGGG
jgi:hypothetical protein